MSCANLSSAKIEKLSENRIQIAGAFTETDVLSLRPKLESMIVSRASADLEIDLSQLESVSSPLLSMFLCLYRQADASGCQLAYTDLPQKLYDMARVGGVESILPLR